LISNQLIGGLRDLLLLAIIVLALQPHLSKQAANNSKVGTNINIAIFTITAILWVPLRVIVAYTSMETMNPRARQIQDKKTGAVFITGGFIIIIYMVLCLIVSIIFVVLIVNAIKNTATPFTPKLRKWTIFTLVTVLLLPICGIVQYVNYAIPQQLALDGMEIALEIINDLCLHPQSSVS
jgi:hypothetical protein